MVDMSKEVPSFDRQEATEDGDLRAEMCGNPRMAGVN